VAAGVGNRGNGAAARSNARSRDSPPCVSRVPQSSAASADLLSKSSLHPVPRYKVKAISRLIFYPTIEAQIRWNSPAPRPSVVRSSDFINSCAALRYEILPTSASSPNTPPLNHRRLLLIEQTVSPLGADRLRLFRRQRRGSRPARPGRAGGRQPPISNRGHAAIDRKVYARDDGTLMGSPLITRELPETVCAMSSPGLRAQPRKEYRLSC